MSTTEQLEAIILETHSKVNAILRRLERRPGLTVTAFAKEAGIGRNTVLRKIKRGELRKENGKIPAQFLDGFLS